MKSFNEFYNENKKEEGVNESTLFSLKYSFGKEKIKDKTDFAGLESYMKSKESTEDVVSFLGKIFKKSRVEAVEGKEDYLIRIGNNTSITLTDPNGYDLYIRATLYNKKMSKDDLEKFADAINKLNLF